MPPRFTTEVIYVYQNLAKHHGIEQHVAEERLHAIKRAAGRGPADNVVFDITGNVYDPATMERLGGLTEGGRRRL